MGYDRMPSFQHQLQSQNGVVGGPRMLPQPLHTSSNGPNGYGGEYSLISPHHQTHPMGSIPPSAPSPLSNLLGHSPDAGSPSWLSMPSPPQPMLSSNVGVRYPVLLPLLPHINSIIPPMLACDLLDLYFTNPSTTFFQPASPYVLTHIFRKRTFLHPTSPRPTSPALLCAMLWVAAQTWDASVATCPSPRGRICQRLLELCIGLLRPLVHVNIGSSQHSHSADRESGSVGVGFGGLGGTGSGREGIGAAGTLDDVLTYIHLGIVISASEFKSASLRWWNAAWTLTRELRLNRELPPPEMEIAPQEQEEGDHHSPTESGPGNNHHPAAVSEEEKEERRRTWWLLYIMDRHLALCYNRPLALLDIECENLYLPIDEISWQNGDFYPYPDPPTHMYQHGSPSAMVLTASTGRTRTTGPVFQITGSGLFDYFLPLMAILGEIVDLHHTRNRPRFGVPGNGNGAMSGAMTTGSPGNREYNDRINEIASHLGAYEQSLQEWEAANCTSTMQTGNTTSTTVTTHGQPVNGGTSEAEIQHRVVHSYGTHVMHVLHILLVGKWDPVSMLDDNDLWISSPGFISATAHAVSAAEAINNILKYDPDLSFMPYFFGIYLLQGSFLLLLIADKLQGEASEAVINACETIVRAHEVCVVTLNTEYQRNFRGVMRSALSQVRGRGLPEDMEEQKLRRREVLQLYRWCGDGTGLAL